MGYGIVLSSTPHIPRFVFYEFERHFVNKSARRSVGGFPFLRPIGRIIFHNSVGLNFNYFSLDFRGYYQFIIPIHVTVNLASYAEFVLKIKAGLNCKRYFRFQV